MNLKILQDSRETPKYASLMVKYEMPSFIKRLQEEIPAGDLFKGDDHGQGLETESHITLFPCLSNDTDLLKLLPTLPKVEELEVELVNVSIFQQQDCDVLKADVKANSSLSRINEALSKDVKSESEFEYHPHMTIAYLKKDSASSINLTRTLEKPVKVIPQGYLYSFYSGNDEKQIMFDVSVKEKVTDAVKIAAYEDLRKKYLQEYDANEPDSEPSEDGTLLYDFKTGEPLGFKVWNFGWTAELIPKFSKVAKKLKLVTASTGEGDLVVLSEKVGKWMTSMAEALEAISNALYRGKEVTKDVSKEDFEQFIRWSEVTGFGQYHDYDYAEIREYIERVGLGGT